MPVAPSEGLFSSAAIRPRSWQRHDQNKVTVAYNARAVSGIEEGELVRWAFTYPGVSDLLWLSLGIKKPHRIAFHVTEPVVATADRQTGELDVMLWPSDSPSEAIAIECKRIKIDPETFDTEQPGKLHELRKGVRQANAQLRRGFHQVFLVVIIAVDGRHQSGGYWIGGELTPALRQIIRNSKLMSDLNKDVGYVLVEVVQPVDKDAMSAGGAGVIASRRATPHIQTEQLTKAIEEYVNKLAEQS